MDPWALLFALGLRQHGVVTRRQAIALGITATSFDRRVLREGWHRLHPGVWLLPGADRHAFFTRVSAALLAVGDHALATGWTGLFAHGVLLRPPPIVTLVVPWQRGTRQLRAVRIIRSRTLLDDDRATLSGLAVATPQRCFLDAARTDGRPRLRTMLIDARQRRIAEPATALARGLLHPSVPGAKTLIAAARDVDAVGADSVLSDLVHRRLIDAGLAPDSHPATVATPGGRILHPDITFAASKVCIECDSLGFHGTQRGLALDHQKDQGYRQASWNCLRIGWFRYDTDWDGFERDVRLAVAAAAGRGG